MLEQRIENLENQVTKLTTAIEKLIEVLTSGTAPTPTPPPLLPPIAQLNSLPAEEQVDLEAQTGSNPPSAPAQPKVEEVQKALVDLTHAHGREAAVSLLNRFHGANKVGDLNKDQYAEVIAAADNLTWKVAA